jgi:cytochrome c biogenesis protein CcmG, thiol:disulfide interchange protein DsbE
MFISPQIFYFMNLKIASTITALLFFCTSIFSQESLPSVKLKSVSGKEVSLASLANDCKDTLLVVSFWATWCIPCITELENINEEYLEKQAIKPFKFIGVSIDDSRTAQRVKPFIKGKGWKFDVLLDINSELKRAINVTDVPHVIIIKNGKIVYRHTGYIAGEEDNLFEKIKSL